MQDLEITWPEGAARFSVADSPIHLGRSSGAAVPLTEGSVSRKHLMLVWDGRSWIANDNSTHGTFDAAGVRLPTVWTVSSERTLRLGGIEGVPVQIQPSAAGASTTAPMTAPVSKEPGSLLTPQAQPGPAATPQVATPSILTPSPGAATSSSPDRVPVAGHDQSSKASDSALFNAPEANEPMLRFSEDSLFPDGSKQPSAFPEPSPTPNPEPNLSAASESPSDGAMQAPSLLESDTVSAFAGPPPGPPTPKPASQVPPSTGPQDTRPQGTGPQGATPPSALEGLAPPSALETPQAPSSLPALQTPQVPSALDAPQAPALDVPAAPSALERPPLAPFTEGGSPAPSAIPSYESQAPQEKLGSSSSTRVKPTLLGGPGTTGANPAIDPNSTLISDAALRVTVAGQDYSFLPGADVTIGRDPTCLIQLDERHSLVSRKHLRITYIDDAWWLEDYSSKGTFINGKRLKKPYKAEGAFVANLGDDDAGTSLRIITAGEHRVPRDKTTLIIAGLALAALVPLVTLAFLLTRNNANTVEPDFATAKKSTVMLFGLEGGQGSGFFVSDDLIVTNQHVSVLSPQLLVGVSRDDDQPAQIEYATELVANHPFLDLAVLRVSNKVSRTSEGTEISSEPVGDIDLPAVTIGDSADVTIGDRVFNTGFPGRLSITSLDDAGELRLPSVVATSGEAANFAFWPGCSNADADLYIPADSPDGVGCSASGDLNRGVLLSSFFSSGQGASGSAVYHNNEVVAVVYAGADGEANANLGITTAIFSDWLAEIIAQNP